MWDQRTNHANPVLCYGLVWFIGNGPNEPLALAKQMLKYSIHLILLSWLLLWTQTSCVLPQWNSNLGCPMDLDSLISLYLKLSEQNENGQNTVNSWAWATRMWSTQQVAELQCRVSSNVTHKSTCNCIFFELSTVQFYDNVYFNLHMFQKKRYLS